MSKKAANEPKVSSRFYIGGGNIGMLLGLHPTLGPLDLYNELLGITPRPPQDALMEKGLALEPLAATKYEKDTGRKLRRAKKLIHPEYEFLQGHIDRELVDTGDVWEAKCPVSRRFSRWKQDGLPQNLIAQLHLYMGLKGTPGGVWSILNSDLWQSANFSHEASKNSYEIMVEVGVRFWRQHIEKRIPPPEGLVENPLVEFDVVPGELVRVETPEFLEAMQLLRQAKQHVTQAANLESLAKERVKEALGDRQGKYVSSEGKLYWTQQKGRRTFDHELLARALPLDRVATLEVLETVLSKGQLKAVLQALRTCDLELDQFFKVGEPFEMFRPYFSKQSDEDED